MHNSLFWAQAWGIRKALRQVQHFLKPYIFSLPIWERLILEVTIFIFFSIKYLIVRHRTDLWRDLSALEWNALLLPWSLWSSNFTVLTMPRRSCGCQFSRSRAEGERLCFPDSWSADHTWSNEEGYLWDPPCHFVTLALLCNFFLHLTVLFILEVKLKSVHCWKNVILKLFEKSFVSSASPAS